VKQAMAIFMTKAWMDEYRKMVNQNKEYKDSAKGWGVGFNGDFIFQVEKIPLDKIPTKALPADVAKEMKEYIVNGTSYMVLQLKDGECTGAYPIKDPKQVKVGFVMKGPYENWKKLARAQVDPIKALLARQFVLEGDMAKIMKYAKAANLLAATSAATKTEFPDEVQAKK
jgi:putative sterol carrier protein